MWVAMTSTMAEQPPKWPRLILILWGPFCYSPSPNDGEQEYAPGTLYRLPPLILIVTLQDTCYYHHLYVTDENTGLSNLCQVTQLARGRMRIFRQSDSMGKLSYWKRKSESWPKGHSYTVLMRTDLKFTAMHWTWIPGRPTILQMPTARAWGRNFRQVSVLRSSLTVTSLPHPEAGKVGAVFPHQRGPWLWVSKQGKVDAKAEPELEARPLTSRHSTLILSFKAQHKYHLPWGNFFPPFPNS